MLQFMAAERFDDLTDIYEATIDWPKRLANEAPFYRWLFDRVGAKSVLDVACGTGHHAAMFGAWGLRVQGADASTTMLQRAAQLHGKSESLSWVQRGFDRPVERLGWFDVAICVGNSLALAPDESVVASAITQMLAGVRSGGAVLVHVLNLWKFPDGPAVWQKCIRANLPQGDCVIAKGVHRCGNRGYVELFVAPLATSPIKVQSESVPFLGVESRQLELTAKAAGATQVEFFGDYQRSSYIREKTQDLIMVAIKG